MFSPKTALGIDISDGRISLALLKQNANGIESVSYTHLTLPTKA